MNDHEDNPADNQLLVDCPNCKGEGTIPIPDIDEPDHDECKVCDGRGTLHPYYDRSVLREWRE